MLTRTISLTVHVRSTEGGRLRREGIHLAAFLAVRKAGKSYTLSNRGFEQKEPFTVLDSQQFWGPTSASAVPY